MSGQSVRAAPPEVLPAVRGGAVAVAGGLLTGGFAAWAYYDDLFRPLSHTFGLWITLVALLSARQSVRLAVVRATCALIAAVLAFYVGKKVMYGIDYPGMPYPLNVSVIEEWLVLAVLAGVVLGWAFHWVGRDDRAGAVATAGAVGLLIADAVRRSTAYPSGGTIVITFAVLAVLLVLAVAVRSIARLGAVAAWTVPMAAVGLTLVSAPDLIEQLLITGSF